MTTRGIVQPLVLAAVLAAGFAVVWGVVSLWAVEVGGYVAGAGEATERLQFLADGTPLVAHAEERRGDLQYRDLEGNPVSLPEDRPGGLTTCALPAMLKPPAGDVSWEHRVHSFVDGQSPTGFWYFLTDGRPDGSGYFVGYDRQSKACIGYLGTAGLRETPPPAAERFPFAGDVSGPHARVYCTANIYPSARHPDEGVAGRAPRGSVSTWDVYVLGRDGKLYHADLHQRTVAVALDQPGLRSAALVAGPADRIHGAPHRPAARTDDAVLVLDETGRVRSRYPIPESLRGRSLNFAETSAGEAVMYWNSPFDEMATEVAYRIYWVAADGSYREAKTTLPWVGSPVRTQVFGGVIFPAPLVLSGFVAVMRPPALLEEGLAGSYGEALGRALTEYRPALTITLLLAVGLAVLCYRRQVRYGSAGSARWLWPLFVLLLGLPGWVAYRFGRPWPVLEACPACQARVPRDRGACARCEADFPPPALKGIEVFA
jgi:hypothetical protein